MAKNIHKFGCFTCKCRCTVCTCLIIKHSLDSLPPFLFVIFFHIYIFIIFSFSILQSEILSVGSASHDSYKQSSSLRRVKGTRPLIGLSPKKRTNQLDGEKKQLRSYRLPFAVSDVKAQSRSQMQQTRHVDSGDTHALQLIRLPKLASAERTLLAALFARIEHQHHIRIVYAVQVVYAPAHATSAAADIRFVYVRANLTSYARSLTAPVDMDYVARVSYLAGLNELDARFRFDAYDAEALLRHATRLEPRVLELLYATRVLYSAYGADTSLVDAVRHSLDHQRRSTLLHRLMLNYRLQFQRSDVSHRSTNGSFLSLTVDTYVRNWLRPLLMFDWIMRTNSRRRVTRSAHSINKTLNL